MGVSQHNRIMAIVERDCTLADAARLMITETVGAVVVKDPSNGAVEGIVTDRDIVRCVARGADTDKETVESLLGPPVASVEEGATRREVLKKMRVHGVRRIPVFDANGNVTSIMSLDDIVMEIGRELSDLEIAIETGYRNEIAAYLDDANA